MNAFELAASLTLDTSQYDKGLDEASESAGGFQKALSTAGKVGAAAVTAVATATVAMGTAAVKATSETAAYGDNIDKMSQKVGMSTEAYQQWDYILKISGTEMASMTTGMKTLTNKLDEAKSGSESATKMFEALGLSMDDLAGMSREDVFSAVISGFQQMEDSTERAALANDLFGKSGQELTPLFNTSIEETQELKNKVRELGGIMSDEAVKAAANYTDSMTNLQTSFQGLSRNMTSQFLPSLSTVIDGLSMVFSGNGENGLAMISQGVTNLLDTLNENMPKFIDLGMGIIDTLITAFVENLPQFADAALQIIMALTNTIIANLPAVLDAAVQILFAIVDGIIENLPVLIPAIVNVILTIVNKLTEPSTLMKLIQAAFQIISAVARGLINAIPELVKAVPSIIGNLIEAILRFLPQLAASGLQLIVELGIGIANGAANVVNSVIQVLSGARDAFMQRIADARQWGADLIRNFISGIVARAQELWSTLQNVAQGVRNFLGFSEPKVGPLSNFHTYAPDMMELFAKGIRDNEDMLYNTVAEAFDFGEAVINPSASASGSSEDFSGFPHTIVVQSILDGKVIGETAYKYQRDMARATG